MPDTVPTPPASDERAVPPVTARTARAFGVVGWVGRSVPPLVVFACLGGLLAWGHRTGWTVSNFSALTGEHAPAKDDWCVEHGVPASVCVECSPDVFPRGAEFGWCRTHGVHDCPLCHPEVAQLPTRAVVTPADRKSVV